MRACLLATELARRAGLDAVRQVEVYYGTLMRFAGCAATSHEIAAVFGDDIVVRARGDLIDPAEPAEALEFLAGLGVDAARLRALGGPAATSAVRRTLRRSLQPWRPDLGRSGAQGLPHRVWSATRPAVGQRRNTLRRPARPSPG